MKITEKKTQTVISLDYTKAKEITKLKKFFKDWEKKNDKKLKLDPKMIIRL